MKTIFLTMTSLAALSVAAPAAAQPWTGQRANTANLQTQLDAGIRSGTISRREAMPLRSMLRELVSLEHQFSRNGFTGRENAALRQRSNTLSRQIRMAERTGPVGRWNDRDRDDRDGWRDRDDDRRDGWRGRDKDERDGNGRWSDRDDRYDGYVDARFDRPNRGDRFNGDARVGHMAGMRMSALPEQFRNQFRDTDQVYYRFDNGRIYRINRTTNMILGLFDI